MNFLRKLFGKKEAEPEGHEDATVEGHEDATVEGAPEDEGE
ncbi:MAG: hypothetical protein ACXACI_06350 [Candidatus Hodarchaeales archaeon]|jgi:hypothetical protein